MERLLVVASERIGKEDKEATGEQEEEFPASSIADQWMRRLYRDSLWKRFKGWLGQVFVSLIFGASKGTAAKRIVKVLVSWILTDLERFGLINGAKVPVKDNVELSKELHN